jgi:hypothetical protein
MLDDSKLDDSANTLNLRFLKDELHSFAAGMRALDRGDVAAAQAASAEMDAGLWREGQDAQSVMEDTVKATLDKMLASAGATQDTKNTMEDMTKKMLDSMPAAGADAQTAAGATPTNNPARPPNRPAPTSANVRTTVTLPLNPDALNDPLVKMLSVASLELRAGTLLVQGKTDDAQAMYQRAIAAEKKLGYHEPPFYICPVAETEAEALLRAKDYAGAKKAYQEALLERPNSGFELYGIAHADELAGQEQAAKTEYQDFLKAWPSADPALPQMVHARQALGASASMASK